MFSTTFALIYALYAFMNDHGGNSSVSKVNVYEWNKFTSISDCGLICSTSQVVIYSVSGNVLLSQTEHLSCPFRDNVVSASSETVFALSLKKCRIISMKKPEGTETSFYQTNRTTLYQDRLPSWHAGYRAPLFSFALNQGWRVSVRYVVVSINFLFTIKKTCHKWLAGTCHSWQTRSLHFAVL